MILYRARTIASRPQRNQPYQGNDAAIRVRGRWFTSRLELAIAHLATLEGPTEIIQIDVSDDIADTFRVSNTPNTACGLPVIDFSASPDTDYVLQTFRVMEATSMSSDTRGRVRDYIDVARIGGIAPLTARPAPSRPVELPLAA